MKKRASRRPNKVPSNASTAMRGCKSHADALGGAANHARVLNGEHMPSGYTSRRTGRRRGHHLAHGHCWIVQKARHSDPPPPVLTEPTNTYAPPAQFHQSSV